MSLYLRLQTSLYLVPGVQIVWAAQKRVSRRERERAWGGGAGEGLLGLILAGYVPLASQSPYPIIVFSVDDEKSKDYCKADTT